MTALRLLIVLGLLVMLGCRDAEPDLLDPAPAPAPAPARPDRTEELLARLEAIEQRIGRVRPEDVAAAVRQEVRNEIQTLRNALRSDAPATTFLRILTAPPGMNCAPCDLLAADLRAIDGQGGWVVARDFQIVYAAPGTVIPTFEVWRDGRRVAVWSGYGLQPDNPWSRRGIPVRGELERVLQAHPHARPG